MRDARKDRKRRGIPLERVESREKYSELQSAAKQQGFARFTNNYLNMDAVERYIGLGRMEYEWDGGGLYLYTDEGPFYRLYIRCGENGIKLSEREKPVLVRNVYREGSKGEALQDVEGQLRRLGFTQYSRSAQILAAPLENRENVSEKLRKAEKFLARFGLRITYADRSQLEDIFRLRDQEPDLKPYHFSYETMEEKERAIEKGYFRCVVNAENKLCAAQQFSVERNGIQGNWLAVETDYKEKYGIGAAMAYHSFAYAIERNIGNYFGWLERDNEKSLRYHQSIGYRLTGKVAEDWVR